MFASRSPTLMLCHINKPQKKPKPPPKWQACLSKSFEFLDWIRSVVRSCVVLSSSNGLALVAAMSQDYLMHALPSLRCLVLLHDLCVTPVVLAWASDVTGPALSSNMQRSFKTPLKCGWLFLQLVDYHRLLMCHGVSRILMNMATICC